jgi:hypothetical protein
MVCAHGQTSRGGVALGGTAGDAAGARPLAGPKRPRREHGRGVHDRPARRGDDMALGGREAGTHPARMRRDSRLRREGFGRGVVCRRRQQPGAGDASGRRRRSSRGGRRCSGDTPCRHHPDDDGRRTHRSHDQVHRMTHARPPIRSFNSARSLAQQRGSGLGRYLVDPRVKPALQASFVLDANPLPPLSHEQGSHPIRRPIKRTFSPPGPVPQRASPRTSYLAPSAQKPPSEGTTRRLPVGRGRDAARRDRTNRMGGEAGFQRHAVRPLLAAVDPVDLDDLVVFGAGQGPVRQRARLSCQTTGFIPQLRTWRSTSKRRATRRA